MTPVPNLFLVGAMKAGTTALHEHLERHPRVFMSDPKEPSHFADGAELETVSRRIWEAGYWRNRSSYLNLFAAAGDAAFIGESSTAYSKRSRIEGVVGRIARFNPDARIIYIMREPVERTVSHYLHAVRWNDERRSPLRAAREELHYREVSHYAMQLQPYLETFGYERVHVLTLEALRDELEGELSRLFGWLGLSPHSVERPASRNATADSVVRPRGPQVLHRAWRSRRLAPVRRLLPEFCERWFERGLVHTIKRDDPHLERMRDYLRPRQRAELAELVSLLGRDFPEWDRPLPSPLTPHRESEAS